MMKIQQPLHVVSCKYQSIATSSQAVVMLVLFSLCLGLSGCSGRKKTVGEAITERDSMPVMDTRGVTTLISDSGVIRYRIKTEEWKVFDRKNPPHWAFEQGIYLEQFDSLFQVQASITADTAYFYNREELWKLVGHVDIKNLQGERFNTELLYWDQRKQKVYSDRFIRIEQPDRIITGRGFTSNQQMTVYTIHKPEGIFYVEDDAMAADTVKNDTVKNKEPIRSASPVKASPVTTAPVKASPVKASPVKASPVTTAPVKISPLKKGSPLKGSLVKRQSPVTQTK